MPTINVEIKTAIKTKSKKDIRRLHRIIESFCIVLAEDFPQCERINLCIYDNKECIRKMINETVLN